MSVKRLVFGSFVLDVERGSLTRDGRPVVVGNKGLELLQAFLSAPGQTISKSRLMEAAWPGTAVEDSNLTVQVAALRKLLGPSPAGGEWIATIPRVGYRFVGPPPTVDADAEPNPGADRTARPTIAVLPFANISGEMEQEYLADGITEDIIVTLTRFRWFQVVGRNSSFVYKNKSVGSTVVARDLGVQYLLEGSVRKSGQRLRVTAQLIDAARGVQVWAERYELDMADAFALQDAIAERVVGAIEPELLKTESLAVSATHTGDLNSWDLVRQGTWLFHRVGRETHLEARDLFRKAAALDPSVAEAHIWLARVSAGIVAYGWSGQPTQDIGEGLDAAVKAIRLDDKNPYSHYALAITSAYANAPEQATLAAEKAIELSPSFALGHLVLGMAHLYRGQAAAATAPLEHGLALSPHDPQSFVWLNLLALGRLFAGDADGALSAAITALKSHPSWRPTLETLILCYVALDRMDEARQCIEQSRHVAKPQGDALAPLRARNRHWADQIAHMLAKAGVAAA
jgi:TolB-like protein